MTPSSAKAGVEMKGEENKSSYHLSNQMWMENILVGGERESSGFFFPARRCAGMISFLPTFSLEFLGMAKGTFL